MQVFYLILALDASLHIGWWLGWRYNGTIYYDPGRVTCPEKLGY